MAKTKVKPVSFREQDLDLYEHLCQQPNVSNYVRELIRRDKENIASENILLEIKNLILEMKNNGITVESTKENTESFYDDVLNLINFD